MDVSEGRRATLKDVASLAHVSYQTVSRVINDDPRVRAGTRTRVEAAIRQLRYQPSAVARALVRGESRTIGVLLEDLQQYGTGGVLRSLQDEVGRQRWDLALATIRSGEVEAVSSALASLRQRGVRAVVLLSSTADVAQAAVAEWRDASLISASQALETAAPLGAWIDQRTGVEKVIDHLVGSGRVRIAHLRGPHGSLDAAFRATVMRQRLESHGLTMIGEASGDWSAAGGYGALHRLHRECRYDALFCANDQMALGALAALRELEMTVPEQVAVVGFDDIPEASFFNPRLSTVRQDFTELGAHLVELALGRDEPVPPISAEFIIRGSG